MIFTGAPLEATDEVGVMTLYTYLPGKAELLGRHHAYHFGLHRVLDGLAVLINNRAASRQREP